MPVVKFLAIKKMKQPIIIVCGNYGTGKSTVSNFLARQLQGYRLLGIREAREKMGILTYRCGDIPNVMVELDRLVRMSLGEGLGVIVRRPHSTYQSRMISYSAAKEHRRQLLIIECICPEGVAKERMAARPTGSNNDTTNYDWVKSIWNEISSDYQIDPSLKKFVSYVKYDTFRSLPLQIRVTNSLKEFAGRISELLENFRPQ